MMKKVEAIIRLSAFDAVREALEERGIRGVTVTEVLRFGDEPAGTSSYRGVTYRVDSHPRLRLEIVLPGVEARPVAHVIARAARTGHVGDGLVTIIPVAKAIRIRTGERGVDTVSSSPVPLRPQAPSRVGGLRAVRPA